jgi:hypothetical protein
MSKIPKEIVDKIEQRNKLNEEIGVWCEENLDMDEMCSDCADITDYHTGDEQETVSGREWCEQWIGYCEDDYYGHYYWETEYLGKYLHMEFWL